MKKENYTTYLNNEVVNVRYNGKIYVIPKPFNQCDFSDEPTAMEKVSNRFNGESVLLPRFAVAIYDVIMGSEQIASNTDRLHGDGTSPLWDTVRKGLDWFRKYFAKEYMVLLD